MSERPFSVKSNNSSSHREGHQLVLSADSASVVSLNRQEQNITTLMTKNNELKEELHKSRKHNGELRSKVSKYEKINNDLRNTKLELLNKVEKLEKARERDAQYISQQEREIQSLHEQLRKATAKRRDSYDTEKEQLRTSLEKTIEVKLKYEHIINALMQKSEIKPIIARILEDKHFNYTIR